MKQTTTRQASHPLNLFPDIKEMLMWGEVQLLGALLLTLLIARILRTSDKLADARWADKRAIRHARRKALAQIKNPQIGKATALYLGDLRSCTILNKGLPKEQKSERKGVRKVELDGYGNHR